MPATAAPRTPVRRITVLYDERCSLCTFVRGWLARQPQLVPLDLVPCGSAEARRRFPGLDHEATVREITAIGDAGQVYRGQSAWLVVLWALARHRRTAHRLATRAGAPLARAAVLTAARYRRAQGQVDPAGRPPRWGGGTYAHTDGWRYDPRTGWSRSGTCPDGRCRPAD